MVIDHEFFMGDFEKIKNKDEEEIKKIKERLIGFINDILGPDDKHIFLL
jgi:calcineurin-like phosphoesterase family protein